MAYRFRDSKTGRFSTWQVWRRSRARGGTRYKRERIQRKGGWKTGFIIRSGYDSLSNPYTLIVAIRPYKRLSDQDMSNLIEKLAGLGHFDDHKENPVADLRWATFHNSFDVVKRGVKMKRGRAILIGFERNRP
jgi:hypothetical protein